MSPVLITAAGNPVNQDRGVIIHEGSRIILCVADGAGGRSGGTEAAVMATEFLRQNASRAVSADACMELLREMDAVTAKDTIAGETTCALAVVTPDEIFGASVGDSGAWLIPEAGSFLDLTLGQQRKPFIGSGAAWPMPYGHPVQNGILLLATDGLLKYTSAERIIETCRQCSIEQAAQQLIELVRYASGTLPDDVTVILAGL